MALYETTIVNDNITVTLSQVGASGPIGPTGPEGNVDAEVEGLIADATALLEQVQEDVAANEATRVEVLALKNATDTNATNAANSATAADTSADAAAASATAADTSADASAASASAASGSATTAGTHATNAGNSATSASGFATTAGTHATNAANSATAADTSADAAAASATAADTSADAAAASAADAATAFGLSVKTADLSAANTVAMMGYTAAEAQAIFDNAIPMANYTALRNYTGTRGQAIRITTQGIAGTFQLDEADTTTADNAGTILVDASNRRWKRLVTDHVSVAWFAGGTDHSALNTAVAVGYAMGIFLVVVPRRLYTFEAGETVDVAPFMTLRGEVPGPFDNFGASPGSLIIGATFAIKNTTTPFMTLYGNSSKVSDIIFYYPNQVAPTAATPTAYPFTIQTEAGTGGTRISRCTLVNSYNGIDMRSGRGKIEDCVIGAFANDINVDEAQDWVEIVNIKSQCMWDVFAGLTFPQNIDAWVMSNGISLRTKRVDSLVVSNYSVFGRYMGHLFEDSPNTGLTPRNGYGRFSNVDLDYVAYGVYGVSSNTTARGFQYTNVTVGANGSGVGTPGQWAFGTAVGGTASPSIYVNGGAIRGTWATGPVGVPVPPPAGRIYVSNVLGLNPLGAAKTTTPSIPASDSAVTNNYPSVMRIFISGGTVSSIKLNGVATGTTSGSQLVYPGETIAIVYSSAPTWTWHGM
jgi:hypothetical protein